VYNWIDTDAAILALAGGTADTPELVFNPASLPVRQYKLGVRVSRFTDSKATANSRASLLLNVQQASDLSRAPDGDSDGITDIVDQLDGRLGFANELQTRDNDQDNFLMVVSPGLRLELGRTARAAQNDSSSVTRQQIASFGGLLGDPVNDSNDNFEFAGGIQDFRVTNLPEVGVTVDIVIPQTQPIGQVPDYRKYVAGSGWRSFKQVGDDMISSTAGLTGQCPPPGDPSYKMGLASGNRCVQLSITDGGPNDADGLVNGAIADPGGVATPAGEVKTGGGGGGGAVGAGLLGLLSLLLIRRRLVGLAPLLMVAATLILAAMPEPLNAAEKGWYIGAGVGLSSLDPDTDGTPFSVTDDEDTGVKVFAGVDLTSSLSAFGFWADLGSAELEPQGSIDYSVYGAGLLYGFGFRRFTRLSGFVKGGISQLEIDADVPTTDDDDTQLFLGAGASWAIGRRFFVRAEYEYFSEDAQLLSLSLVKRFTFSRTPAKTFPLEDRGVERAEPL
jgi:hypothetical protein